MFLSGRPWKTELLCRVVIYQESHLVSWQSFFQLLLPESFSKHSCYWDESTIHWNICCKYHNNFEMLMSIFLFFIFLQFSIFLKRWGNRDGKALEIHYSRLVFEKWISARWYLQNPTVAIICPVPFNLLRR